MTFTEFQATRKPANAAEMEAAGATPNAEQTTHGLLYAGSHFIESTEGWGKEFEAQGKWYLLLERSEYVSDDLEELEHLLYQWAIDAGNITIDELCSLCRCYIPSGEGLRIGEDIFCSEACRDQAEFEQEAKDNENERAQAMADRAIAYILAHPHCLQAKTFAELHNFCDANVIGGQDEYLDEWNRKLAALHPEWSEDQVSEAALDAVDPDVNAVQRIVGAWLESRKK